MYSAGYDHGSRFIDHLRNMLIALTVIFVVAQLPPQRLMELAVPIYVIGVTLLIAVAIFGVTKKGARRWINLGVIIQPSEILKIATPLMLAGEFNLAEFSFFTRGSVKEVALFVSREVVQRATSAPPLWWPPAPLLRPCSIPLPLQSSR